MSYDVYFVIETGSGHEVDVDERNYTSNVSGMWSKALATTTVRGLDGAPASEAAGVLAAAVERMRANPDDYRPMNPENGWGDYEGALAFLEWMAETAREHPATTIRVSS